MSVSTRLESCTLYSLKKGDRVIISHAHVFKARTWRHWLDMEYIFEEYKQPYFIFKRADHATEKLRIKESIARRHIFKGRLQ